MNTRCALFCHFSTFHSIQLLLTIHFIYKTLKSIIKQITSCSSSSSRHVERVCQSSLEVCLPPLWDYHLYGWWYELGPTRLYQRGWQQIDGLHHPFGKEMYTLPWQLWTTLSQKAARWHDSQWQPWILCKTDCTLYNTHRGWKISWSFKFQALVY